MRYVTLATVKITALGRGSVIFALLSIGASLRPWRGCLRSLGRVLITDSQMLTWMRRQRRLLGIKRPPWPCGEPRPQIAKRSSSERPLAGHRGCRWLPQARAERNSAEFGDVG